MAKEGEAQHVLIERAAEARGIEVVDVSKKHGKRASLLRKGAREDLVLQGVPASWLNERAATLCDHKQQTRELFARLAIPHVKGTTFTSSADLDADWFSVDRRYVCKPEVGTNGVGVALDIRSRTDIERYLARHGSLGPVFVLEEFHDGTDLRLQVIGGEMVAACVRLPAHVEGDGRSTLQELIDARREEMRGQNPANRLDIDDAATKLITRQGFDLGSVVPDGVRVRLKEIANMAQGAHAVDVTDDIHPEYLEWIPRLTSELGTSYFALDVLCKDPASAPQDQAAALEINLRAEWMHHTFSEGRTHDLAAAVVDALFAS